MSTKRIGFLGTVATGVAAGLVVLSGLPCAPVNSAENHQVLTQAVGKYGESEIWRFPDRLRSPVAVKTHGERGLSDAAMDGNVAEVRRLLDLGADVNERSHSGLTALIWAAWRGRLEVTSLLLKRGAHIHVQSVHGFTALNRAARDGHLEVVRLLLDLGAGVDQRVLSAALGNAERKGAEDVVKLLGERATRQSLTEAAEHGEVEQVRRLILASDHVKRQVREDSSTLFAAVEFGHASVLRVLIEHGADPNARDVFGEPILVFAGRSGESEIVSLLLDKGADVKAKDTAFRTALHAAADADRTDVVRLLLERGANIKSGLENGPLIRAIVKGHGKVVEVLLDKGADPNSERGPNGETPLELAAASGNVAVVRLLLGKGAEIDAGGRVTPIERAAEEGRPGVAKLLKERGAKLTLETAVQMGDPDEVRRRIAKREETAEEEENQLDRLLIFAARLGHASVVRVLLDNGADVRATIHQKGVGPEDALSAALDAGRLDVVKLLVEKGAELTIEAAAALGDIEAVLRFVREERDRSPGWCHDALMEASRFGRAEVVRVLAEQDVELSQPDSRPFREGSTALMYAAEGGHTEVTKLLLEKGAIDVPGGRGGNALLCAAQKGHRAIARLLLDSGPDPVYEVMEEREALVRAAENGHAEVVKLLMDRGIAGDLPDDEGRTPLMYAARKGFLETARVLVEKGAQLDRRGWGHRTALHEAVGARQPALVELLLDGGADINATDLDGMTPLRMARVHHFGEIAKLLRARGADE
ncbi:MAG: ankyrin repeat domain-containing protein [Thermodesulfobacteriota bacterium]